MAVLGSYEWAKATGGNLTRAEKRRLAARVVRSYHRLLLGRMRLILGRVPEEAGRIDADSIVPPDSEFAQEGERAAARQPRSVIGHGYRTWIFGSALAQLDGEELDPELFYVGSLLHDAGIVEAVADQDFTIRSAEAAIDVAVRAGVERDRTEAMADGICGHITTRVEAEQDSPLAEYIQHGAIADLLGIRRGEVSKDVRRRASEEHPRGSVAKDVAALWRAESKAVPNGRAALLTRWGRFPEAIRLSAAGD